MAASFIAEILINNEVVWSSTTAIPQQGLNIIVSQFTGVLPLTFRIRALVDG